MINVQARSKIPFQKMYGAIEPALSSCEMSPLSAHTIPKKRALHFVALQTILKKAGWLKLAYLTFTADVGSDAEAEIACQQLCGDSLFRFNHFFQQLYNDFCQIQNLSPSTI
jgi:hypothetical protein